MIKKRKAIFVDEAVFAEFRKQARADGRKYSAFLELILTRSVKSR